MEIKINAIEVATTLAHAAMYDEVTREDYHGHQVGQEEELYKDDEKTQGYKDEYQEVFNRHYDYFFEILTNAMDTVYFPITSVSKEDLNGLGYDTTNVDDDTMKKLANKMADDYLEQLYWIQLPIIADYLNIPKKKTTIMIEFDNKDLDRNGNCPVCKKSWDDGDILEKLSQLDIYIGKSDKEMLEIAGHYGYSKENPKRFSRLIGVEIQDMYDGVSYWQCPDCNNVWDRFSGKHYTQYKQL